MEIPKWEDKTPKENKVEDGRLVRPLEQMLQDPKTKAIVDKLTKLREQGRRFDAVNVTWEDKDARQE